MQREVNSEIIREGLLHSEVFEQLEFRLQTQHLETGIWPIIYLNRTFRISQIVPISKFSSQKINGTHCIYYDAADSLCRSAKRLQIMKL